MSLVVERHINAPPERVWQVLTDPEILNSGGFGIAKIEGDLSLGSKIKITLATDGATPVPFKVVRFDEPQEFSIRLSALLGMIVIQGTVYLQKQDGGTLAELGFGSSGFFGRQVNPKLSQLQPQGALFLDALAEEAEKPAATAA